MGAGGSGLGGGDGDGGGGLGGVGGGLQQERRASGLSQQAHATPGAAHVMATFRSSLRSANLGGGDGGGEADGAATAQGGAKAVRLVGGRHCVLHLQCWRCPPCCCTHGCPFVASHLEQSAHALQRCLPIHHPEHCIAQQPGSLQWCLQTTAGNSGRRLASWQHKRVGWGSKFGA